MVGRAVRADYRRCLNFLSRFDYKPGRQNLQRIRARAIVQFGYGPYHACVRPSK